MQHTIDLFRQKRFKIISERMIEVDSQIVQEVIKKGRVIITCSCENSSTFAHANICRHKRFFIMLPFLKKLDKKTKHLKQYYQTAKDITKDKEIETIYGIILDDLEGLIWKQ